MRKILLLGFLMLQVAGIAGVRTASFDFKTPGNLNPSVEGPTVGSIDVTNKEFSSGSASLSFTRGAILSAGARIERINGAFALKVTAQTRFTIAVSGGSHIKSIIFHSGTIGDLSLVDGQKGEINFKELPVKYVAEESDAVESVSFRISSEPSILSMIEVVYSEPLEPISPYNYSPNETPLSSFSEMKLYFSSAIEKVDGHTPEITGPDGFQKEMSVEVSGTTATLTPDVGEIVKEGSYEITVPEGTFRDAGNGAISSEWSRSFEIKINRATLEPQSVTPDPDLPEPQPEFPAVITVKFDNPVKLADGVSELALYKSADPSLDGDFYNPLKLSVSQSDDSAVQITHEGSFTSEETCYFTVVVPEGTVHNTAYGTSLASGNDRWNKEFRIKYTVKKDTPPEPVDPLKPFKERVGSLLTFVGKVGYPTAESQGATQLTSAKDQADATQADLEAAIEGFYKETAVALPAVDKWYTIASVDGGRHKLYLAYANGAVSLGSTSTPFQVESVENSVAVLKTKDGKYLHVLTATDYVGATTKNVTDAKNYLNNLTLKKLQLDNDVSWKPASGLFTIEGSLGTDNQTGDAVSGQALVDHAGSGAIATNPTDNTVYLEDGGKSSGFLFEEADEPDDAGQGGQGGQGGFTPVDLPQTRIGYKLEGTTEKDGAPAVKNNKESFTLTFNVKSVEITAKEALYIANEAGGTVEEASIFSAEGTSYTLKVNDLPSGNYHLIIPAKTLTCVVAENGEDKNYTNDQIDQPFYIGDDASTTPTDPNTGAMEVETISAVLTETAKTNEELTLTLSDVESVEIATPAADIYVANEAGEKNQSVTLTPVAGSGNKFTFTPTNLSAGNYKLVIPEGALICQKTGATEKVKNAKIELEFQISASGSSTVTGNFNVSIENFALDPNLSQSVPVNQNDLREIYILKNTMSIYADPAKKIELKERFSVSGTPETKAAGHLTNDSKNVDGFHTVKIVWDEIPLPDNLPTKVYTIIIPEASFGDENFGKYLGVVTGAKPADSECTVNKEIRFNVSIDNSVTGIRVSESSLDESTPVYDLQGRRVFRPVRKGVYIVNGRKVVLR